MRVKIVIDGDIRFSDPPEMFDFFLTLPERVLDGDLINISSFVDENSFKDWQNNQLYSLVYSVSYCVWDKDELGIFQIVHLLGE
jgi:hypothetical protein